MKNKNNINFGIQGENFTESFLRSKNFKILNKNYRKFFGEIDIIAEKDNVIVFVEVKSRKTNYSSLLELVTLTKQRRIIETAKNYILEKDLQGKIFRFDVSLIEFDKSKNLKINYIENAFSQEIN